MYMYFAHIFRIISLWSQQIVHQQYNDGEIGATSSSSWWVLEKGRGARYPNSKQKKQAVHDVKIGDRNWIPNILNIKKDMIY